MYNFDKDILETLKKSGWQENREIPIHNILEYYEKIRYVCNDMQLKFLKNFSYLDITFENPRAIRYPQLKNMPVKFI